MSLSLENRAQPANDESHLLQRALVPIMLSDEEPSVYAAAGPQKDDDMHTWMADEDDRRRRLFRLADQQAHVPPRKKHVMLNWQRP